MVSGIIPAAAAPDKARLNTSHSKLPAEATKALPNEQAKVAVPMTRVLPKRSPSGPYTSCNTPYASANAEMALAA